MTARRARCGLLALFAALVAVAASAPTTHAQTVSSTPVQIDREAGVRLAAWVTRPRTTERLPLVVLIGSWNGQSWLDLLAARTLASRGYVVVTYATRGAPGSDGVNNIAGPPDVADASAVIDWALARTPTDPDRIGIGGASYGAGLALLAAANDPRISAVSSLSGWGDLVASMYPGETRNAAIGLTMRTTANSEGRTDAAFNATWRTFLSGTDLPGFLRLMKERSPVTHVDALNARGIAVFLAHTWNETAFPSDQIIDLYSRLTGPRRLELRPGEHISAETPARFGADNDVWTGVIRWFDRTLKSGEPARGGSGIWLRARSSSGMRPAETYTTWDEVSTRSTTFALDADARGHGKLRAAPRAENWRMRVDPGPDPALALGIPIVPHFAESYGFSPPFTLARLVSRRRNAVWVSDPATDRMQIRGAPRVRLTLTPSATRVTAIVHLLAVGRSGRAYFINHQPQTFRGVQPGEPLTVDIALRSTAYDVHAGHRLMLAVSTYDLMYFLDTNPRGAPIHFGGGPDHPASLTLPLR